MDNPSLYCLHSILRLLLQSHFSRNLRTQNRLKQDLPVPHQAELFQSSWVWYMQELLYNLSLY